VDPVDPMDDLGGHVPRAAVWPSARDHSHFLSGLPTDTVTFNPFPGVDITDVYTFLGRHQP